MGATYRFVSLEKEYEKYTTAKSKLAVNLKSEVKGWHWAGVPGSALEPGESVHMEIVFH